MGHRETQMGQRRPFTTRSSAKALEEERERAIAAKADGISSLSCIRITALRPCSTSASSHQSSFFADSCQQECRKQGASARCVAERACEGRRG